MALQCPGACARALQSSSESSRPHALHGAGSRWRCVQYWVRRARLNLAMVEQLDLYGRTAELARTFGIDFQSVLTRGSQYRVESMLVRLAHTQNYLMLSPSREQVSPRVEAGGTWPGPWGRAVQTQHCRTHAQLGLSPWLQHAHQPARRAADDQSSAGGQAARIALSSQRKPLTQDTGTTSAPALPTSLWAQVGRQPAMECLPLVMEPESRFYADPVIVLDFQSLYPSMVIAYNLCFSTCLGRPAHAASAAPLQLGVAQGHLPPGTLAGALQPQRCAPPALQHGRELPMQQQWQSCAAIRCCTQSCTESVSLHVCGPAAALSGGVCTAWRSRCAGRQPAWLSGAGEQPVATSPMPEYSWRCCMPAAGHRASQQRRACSSQALCAGSTSRPTAWPTAPPLRAPGCCRAC